MSKKSLTITNKYGTTYTWTCLDKGPPDWTSAAAQMSLWSRVDTAGTPDGCWPFMGHRAKAGYGQVTFHGVQINTHKMALLTCGVSIPKGMYVCHHCDNPACCRPDHLYVGTPTDNRRDCTVRGRAKGTFQKGRKASRGSANTYAKLTEDAVREIRWLYAQGFSEPVIAEEFGVSRGAVNGIRRGSNWRHVI